MTRSAKVSRREFVGSMGFLSIAILGNGAILLAQGEANAQQPGHLSANAWVKISTNNEITIRFAATEMGQGVMTSLPMILAEELDADWSKVLVEQVNQDQDRTYGNPLFGGNLFTAGSESVEGYFPVMRQGGAAARRVLVHTAAAAWNVPVSEVSSEPSVILHRASGRRMTFGQIAALPKIVSDVPAITETDLKPRSTYRLIGTDPGRRDIPGKTRGETVYSIDVRVPRMVYAAQLHAPVEGETPAKVSDREARAVRGVIDILPLRNSIAVVADRWEVAKYARDLLKVEWTTASSFRSANSATDLAAAVTAAGELQRPATVWSTRGNVVTGLSGTGRRVVEATYTTDYVYHAQMEPLAAVASVDADGKGAEVWLGTQSQSLSIAAAAQTLQTTPDRIRFHAMQMGGGFGRRTFFGRDLLSDALILSRQVKRPVKLIWTREDDVKNAWLRPAGAHKLHAALDETGKVVALRHRVASPSILAFAWPQRWAGLNNSDPLVMEGAESTDYDIPDFLAEHVLMERRARVSAWRAIGWGTNCFARECFIDELAHAAGANPVDFRRRLLSKSARGRAVLEAVVKMSNFDQPQPGRALGLSFAGYKTTLGAGVAELSIDRQSGQTKVHRFWAAVDTGFAIHPNNLQAQVEGGIIYGLSGLLKERVSIVNGEIEQNNFYDYEVLRMSEIPEISIQIVESGAAPSGAGEIGVPMTGAAVANAVFALTGKRLRDMPFTPSRVKTLINS